MRLVIVDSMERYRFMTRLAYALRDEIAFVFGTSEPLAHLLLVRAGFRSFYLRADRDAATHASDAGFAGDDAIEVLNGAISRERARREAASIARLVAELLSRERVTQCVMWNGHQLVCRAVAHACASQGVPMKFLEISNLPDKLFADPLGVNAQSSIGRSPDALDDLPLPDDGEHRAWLARYEAYKAHPLPQARQSLRGLLPSTLNYVLKLATNGVARNELRTVLSCPASVAAMHAITPSADELANRRYVFLPLQVSSDTQLKLHSDVDNLEAIEIALRYARHARAALIVKPHPAERDASLLDAVIALRRRRHFDIATSMTVDLIKHACLVVTINSTVGLEAMLYGKPVAPLGRCFYRSFDRARLLRYIHSFLIDDVDYFGSRAIPAHAARRILSLG
ncbi:capsular biosynthesis protein [Burkholderia stagnalis]|uniref:capsular polysaccharide export protein, LipB/KpsS family n=1 Tax=Burkholderia stagnalis TaxID=1503054 RepID=UPI00075A8C96|nr:capsular biosynthesis protein [Burkholderia stagnalis]KVD93278.1 capsular biosynthesis protein [Burkholderia stagnalis]KWK16180.1 capsular biosynthesis protein [Burkholderia stagnalis]KWK42549.1 capsular biosynthesis protein [Burkholderia stagnalis]KWK52940.1 capsular biosynthesis protein [Burkholderia stagnalis]KWN77653.1 capsular biosynthesis protein [Burkholderia stagnalis]